MKIIFSIIFLIQMPLLLIAEKKIDLERTFLIGKEKQIYSIRKIKVDRQNCKYILGTFKGGLSIDTFYIFTKSSITSNTYENAQGIFVAKYNHNNQLQWLKKFAESDTLDDVNFLIDSADNLILHYFFKQKLFFNNDSLLVNGTFKVNLFKYNSNGDLIWKFSPEGMGYESLNTNAVSISANNSIFSVGFCGLQGSANYMFVFGNDTINGSPPANFLLEIDSNGVIIKAKNLGNLNVNRSVYFAGHYYIIGYSSGSTIQIGNFQISYPGNYSSKCFVAKINKFGNVIWIRKFGTQDIQFSSLSVKALNVNNYGVVITSQSFSNNQNTFLFENGPSLIGSSGVDFSLYCLDLNGNFKWNTISQSIGSEYISELETDSNSNVYGVGTMNYTLKFPSDTLNSNGGDDVFVCSYDSNGAFRFAINGGGANADVGSGIAKDSDGKLWIVGGTTSNNGCYMGNDTVYPPANQSTLFYASIDSIVDLNYEPVSISQYANLPISQFNIFPNPVQNEVAISFAKHSIGKLQIQNAMGQAIYSYAINHQAFTLNTSTWSNGLYFVSFKNAQTSVTKKIIVQH